ncbi:LysR substrate-binding domain-containing protein, partial [Paraburkholderia adhaesiva]|uniref:LysR substrate-binding domain-containing protein n=1 Tax=Paraburkholderia adhaesiva TaxID=2883244 RepID=UPI001F442174
LPDVLGRFLQEHGNVNIELREAPSNEIVRSVAENLADIGIVAGDIDPGQLEMLPYRNDRLVLVTRTDHPLALRESVRFAETLDNDFVGLPESTAIHAFVQQAANALGRRLRLRIQVASFEAACRMIAAGAGIGIIPASIAWKLADNMDIAPIALDDPWAERRLNLCVRNVESLPQFSRSLLTMLASGDA